MIDQELIEFHDGELTSPRAEQVRRVLNVDPIRRARLEAVRRIDDALVASDIVSPPTAEQVERGKAALMAKLRERSDIKNRRRLLIAIASFGSVAAAIAVVWYVQASRIIGDVTYAYATALHEPTRAELRLGSRIQTSGDLHASITIRSMAQLRLGPTGIVEIGKAPSEIRLVTGTLRAETQSGLTISIASTEYRVIVDAHTVLTIHVKEGKFNISQQQGRCLLTGGSGAEVLDGKTGVSRDIP